MHLAITLDELQTGGSHTATALVDLGAGNDRLYLHNWRIEARVTLGAGQDRVELGINYLTTSNTPFAPLVITDFQAGAGGDVIDLGGLVTNITWTLEENPFATGHLRAYQEGADTVFYIDHDGIDGESDLLQVVRLSGVQLSALTAFNLNGIALDGAALVGLVHSGTANADLIDGNAGNDVLTGLGGDDEIYGGHGDDRIEGGAGNDRLFGGNGDDILIGGDGDDVIRDVGEGSDTIEGGAGNDQIVVDHGYRSAPETIRIDGGTGDDVVDFASAHYGGSVTVDLGAGNDRLTIRNMTYLDAPLRVTTGAGQDVIAIGEAGASNTPMTIEITDFQTGDAGDRLDWLAYAQLRLNVAGDADTFDPFLPSWVLGDWAQANATLVQSGADTILRLGGVDLVIFRNTNVGDFTDFNLGIVSRATGTTGTAADDLLSGTANSETLSGLDGDDRLFGQGGDDTLQGGDGNDLLSGETGNDILIGGAGRDHLDGGDGDDRIEDADGQDVLRGGAGADTFIVGPVADDPTVPVGSLDAGSGNDVATLAARSGYHVAMGTGDDLLTLLAGSGDAWIDLGEGADRLSVAQLSDDVDVVLGGGNDIVTLAAGAGAGDGVLRLVDFDTRFESNRDQLDFTAALAALTNNAWTAASGVNPFAAGFAELCDSAAGVELWFHPSDTPGAGSVLGAVFAYLTVADMTAASFAGTDPTPGIRLAHQVTGVQQVGTGETLEATNPVYFESVRPHIVYGQSGGGSQTLVNSGLIHSVQDGYGGSVGTLVGIYVQFSGSAANALFHNAASGTVLVETTAQTDLGPYFDLYTRGFYLRSSGDVDFRNDGLFEVRTTQGYAIGIETYQNISIVNNGTLRVTSPDYAIGISRHNSSALTNTGLIEVTGGQLAIAVEIDNYAAGGFVNSGEIVASIGPNASGTSIGVMLWQNSRVTGGPSVLVNSGTIAADIAIFVNFEFGYGTNYRSAERIENSGEILGDVYLSYGDDEVINTGLMSGATLLESGNDLYDGRDGVHHGLVDGGTGDDRLFGGAQGDWLSGGRGNDVVMAGGGDDLVQGGGGNDALDGGAGYDILTFADAWQGVSVDLALGTALDRGTAYLRNFEAVVGSDHADTIRGSDAAEMLEGAAGDDVLVGGGGNDVLIGDSGNDRLTGGAGNDRFLFSDGDGIDRITDFQSGDLIEIFGYSGYQSMVQDGADVRITLSGGDAIILENVQLSAIPSGALIFRTSELGPEPVGNGPEFLRVDEPGLVVAAGTVLDLSHTEFQSHFRLGLHQSALWIETVTEGPQLFNAGVIRAEADASDAPLAGMIFGDAVSGPGGYASGDSRFVNLAGGVFEVIAHNGDAWGTVGAMWNAGTIRASAADAGSDAFAVYLPSGRVHNSGSIVAEAGGSATGIEQAQSGFHNSGSVTATGGEASVGIVAVFNVHPAHEPGTAVNSGTITVTDSTAWLDSVALQFDVFGAARFWNSGTVTGDFALQGGARSGSSFTVWNNGRLEGLVRMGGGEDLLTNSGVITGAVDLLGGADLYDGRLGRALASVSGGDGDDRLYSESRLPPTPSRGAKCARRNRVRSTRSPIPRSAARSPPPSRSFRSSPTAIPW